MAISIDDIKKLRAMTGAGLADVKKALTEADGDFDKAKEQPLLQPAAAIRPAGGGDGHPRGSGDYRRGGLTLVFSCGTLQFGPIIPEVFRK